VRPLDFGLTSGTPFFRLLTDKTLPAFDFIEVGLQPQCNSATHVEWLRHRGGHVLTLNELLENGRFVETFLERTTPFLLHPRPTFLSVDIDAFSSAFAPGCSQSWSTGLVPNDFFRLLNILLKRLDVRMLGIYEVSPPLDVDNRTAKLAAQIVHGFLYPA
jgi:formiminoglutamase